MSDPSADLQAAITSALRADAGLAAAFGAAAVKVYDTPPVNKAEPYVVVGEDDVLPLQAECIDGAETDCTVHVWSLTSPPGKLRAKQIGGAVQACLLAIDAIDGHRVISAEPVRSAYLTDPGDGKTAHGVIVVRFSTEPL